MQFRKTTGCTLTIPSARTGQVRVPGESQASPKQVPFFCGQGWEAEGRRFGAIAWAAQACAGRVGETIGTCRKSLLLVLAQHSCPTCRARGCHLYDCSEMRSSKIVDAWVHHLQTIETQIELAEIFYNYACRKCCRILEPVVQPASFYQTCAILSTGLPQCGTTWPRSCSPDIPTAMTASRL